MNKLVRRAALIAPLALAAAAAPAKAADWSWSGCGGVTFTSCATVTITISGNLLDLYVSHNAGSLAGTRFGAIGLANFGGTGVTGAYLAGDPGWNFGANLSSINVLGVTPLGAKENGANPKGLFVGNDVTFRFTKTGGSWDLSDAYFIAHAQGGPTSPVDCGSSFLAVEVGPNNTGTVIDPKGQGGALSGPKYSNDDCIPPHTTVPEPATMVLLASGLVGMAGMQLRRRRSTGA